MMHLEHNGGVAIVFDRLSFAEIVCCSHWKKGESRKRERGLYTRSEQLQAGQILRIDHTDRNFVVINHDEIVDSVGLEQLENFNGELVFVPRHWIQRHQI